MRNRKSPFLVALLTIILLASCKPSSSLFTENSKDWEVTGNAAWSFSNKVLTAETDNGEGYLVTKKAYTDFILELDFKPDSTINSGVYIRCENDKVDAVNCYEVNIWDSNPNQDYSTGAIVLNSVPLTKVETLNRWNTYKIKAIDNRIQIWVNNILTTDYKEAKFTGGYVGLQAMGSGEISFKNIRIKALD